MIYAGVVTMNDDHEDLCTTGQYVLWCQEQQELEQNREAENND